MFFIPAVCFVAGLALMGKTKPKTAVHKIVALGPRSGIVWNVEDFREIGEVVVRDPTNCRACAVFVRAAVYEKNKPGLVWRHGFGDPTLLSAIRADFGVEPTRPQVVRTQEQADSKQPERAGSKQSEPPAASRKPNPQAAGRKSHPQEAS